MEKTTITKELFISSIEALKKQYEHDKKCSEAFKIILPNDYISSYENHLLTNQLIKILQESTNDNHSDSWIEYYIYELDFGSKWQEYKVMVKDKPFKLETSEELWELLNLEV